MKVLLGCEKPAVRFSAHPGGRMRLEYVSDWS